MSAPFRKCHFHVAAWLSCLICAASPAAEGPIQLRERFSAGYEYHVSTRVDLSGTLTLPTEKGKPLSVRGSSAIEYDERILDMAKDGQVRKTIRLCRRTDFRRTVGDQQQENALRPAVRRLILLRYQNKEVPFSPDGPLSWGEIDLIRTDVFTPALAGLLAGHPVNLGDRWSATQSAIQELTDLERIDEGSLECRLEQFTTVEKRRYARISFRGTLRGSNEDGPNRQELEGYFFFDLESNHLSYLYLHGKHLLLDKDGKEVGRIEGRFVLTRQANTRSPDLSEATLKGVATEPNADNTLLLYDNTDLGVRFLYPRRWHVASVRGSQVALDSADGSGLLMTLEPPARAPTGARFLAESRDWLDKQKARLLRIEPPRTVRSSPVLEHFALETEMGQQKFVMDYYVTRQKNGGATLAARLLPRDLAALQKEVERIALSVAVTREQVDKPAR
ncbi:MAG TPA: hypothetical protein VMF69_02565 [Gemmataceae bacterium]|nr:hypothetical protein [Gemmataceae bacterium]